jgi:hypothetical protein
MPYSILRKSNVTNSMPQLNITFSDATLHTQANNFRDERSHYDIDKSMNTLQ